MTSKFHGSPRLRTHILSSTVLLKAASISVELLKTSSRRLSRTSHRCRRRACSVSDTVLPGAWRTSRPTPTPGLATPAKALEAEQSSDKAEIGRMVVSLVCCLTLQFNGSPSISNCRMPEAWYLFENPSSRRSAMAQQTNSDITAVSMPSPASWRVDCCMLVPRALTLLACEKRRGSELSDLRPQATQRTSSERSLVNCRIGSEDFRNTPVRLLAGVRPSRLSYQGPSGK